MTDFDNIGYAMFPFLYSSDENNKMPIATIIAIVDVALKNALERLNDRILQIDASIYESYKVNTHLVLNAPFARNCQAEGIVRNTDPSYNRTKNMVYALARSLDSVDLIIENLHLLLTYLFSSPE